MTFNCNITPKDGKYFVQFRNRPAQVTLAQPKTTCQQRQVVVIFNKERHFAVLRLASIDWKSLRTKPAYSGANTWRAIFLFVYFFFVCDEGAE